MSTVNTEFKRRFGELFREARDRHGFSRANLAARLGISPKTLQSWEMGRTFIEDLSLIPEIEHELGINFSQIIEVSVNGKSRKKANPVAEDRVRLGPQTPEITIAPFDARGASSIAKEAKGQWVAVPTLSEEAILRSFPNVSRRQVERHVFVPASWVPRGGLMAAVRMNDGGMEPRLFLGDTVILDCRPPEADKSLGRVLAFDIHGKGLRIRQLHQDDTGEQFIAGGWGGPSGRRQYVYRPEKGCRIVGRVVAVLSAL